ncbi:MAG: siphovirus Gp157 family protein [Oscillospiraceae bacterium]|nr:siphovirus Gp157 family protein [Oscillospiraceae bacterium]
MTLYEIAQEMATLIDPETGELKDYEAFEALSLEREEKIDNVAKWIIDLEAEAKMVKDRADELTKRAQSAKKKADRLKEFLQEYLAGEKRKTADYTIGYRRTEAVEITDEDRAVAWLMEHGEDALTYQQPKISKTAVKEILKSGKEIPGAELVERQSMSVR